MTLKSQESSSSKWGTSFTTSVIISPQDGCKRADLHPQLPCISHLMTLPSVLRTAPKQQRRRPKSLYSTLLYTSRSCRPRLGFYVAVFSPEVQTGFPKTSAADNKPNSLRLDHITGLLFLKL